MVGWAVGQLGEGLNGVLKDDHRSIGEVARVGHAGVKLLSRIISLGNVNAYVLKLGFKSAHLVEDLLARYKTVDVEAVYYVLT